MPRYLPTRTSVSDIREMSRGFYTGDGTRNGSVFGSGLSSSSSSGSTVNSSSSDKNQK